MAHVKFLLLYFAKKLVKTCENTKSDKRLSIAILKLKNFFIERRFVWFNYILESFAQMSYQDILQLH